MRETEEEKAGQRPGQCKFWISLDSLDEVEGEQEGQRYIQCKFWTSLNPPVHNPETDRWEIPEIDAGLCSKIGVKGPYGDTFNWGCDRRWHKDMLPRCCTPLGGPDGEGNFFGF